MDIWQAAGVGDLGDVMRMVLKKPGLLHAKAPRYGHCTPLIVASEGGHADVVRWLLDQGAAVREPEGGECTALFQRVNYTQANASTTVAPTEKTPLVAAPYRGHLEVVRLLLSHPVAKTTINHRGGDGETALFKACFGGRVRVVKALLESGADPTIAYNLSTTPSAKQLFPCPLSAEARRECVAALEVSSCFFLSPL
jgi:hypothetical protein